MKTNKNNEKKSIYCLEEIIKKYFPSKFEENKKNYIDNPKLLGEYFATQSLKKFKLS